MPAIATKNGVFIPICLSLEVFTSQSSGLPENKTVMVKDVVMW